MGLTISSIFKTLGGAKEYRVVMIGLDAAGKTTILYKLNLGETITTIPTIGFNVETVKYKNVDFTVWCASRRCAGYLPLSRSRRFLQGHRRAGQDPPALGTLLSWHGRNRLYRRRERPRSCRRSARRIASRAVCRRAARFGRPCVCEQAGSSE